MKDLITTPQPLKEWLESFEPDRSVGAPVSASFCPLAKFFLSQGASYVRLGYYGIKLHAGASNKTPELDFSTPKWAAEFMRAIDKHAGKAYISAAVALAELEAIVEGLAVEEARS